MDRATRVFLRVEPTVAARSVGIEADAYNDAVTEYRGAEDDYNGLVDALDAMPQHAPGRHDAEVELIRARERLTQIGAILDEVEIGYLEIVLQSARDLETEAADDAARANERLVAAKNDRTAAALRQGTFAASSVEVAGRLRDLRKRNPVFA